MRVLFTVPGRQVATNSAYRAGRGRFWMDPVASEWKDLIRRFAKEALGRSRATESPVSVEIDFYFGSARPDIDGPVKLVLDAIQPDVIRNDRQVARLLVRKHVDREIPRTHVAIATIDHA